MYILYGAFPQFAPVCFHPTLAEAILWLGPQQPKQGVPQGDVQLSQENSPDDVL